MVDLLSAACRFVSLAAAAGVIGIAVFIGGCMSSPGLAVSRLRMWTLGLSSALVLGHVGLLAAQMIALAEAGSFHVGWKTFVEETHVGRVWLMRAFPACVLLIWSLIPARNHLAVWGAGGLAIVYVALAPLGGHASGAERLAPVLTVNSLHVVSMALWLGALPWWLWSVRQFARATPVAADRLLLHTALTRFSRLAMGLIIVIVGSGLWLSDLYIGDQGDLLGTRYGALVLAKAVLLGCALLFADRLRRRFLPTLADAVPGLEATARARRYIALELSCASCVLGCAAWLAQTTPAVHEAEPRWWLPFRWSIDATWAEPAMRTWILAGLSLAVVGIAVAGICRLRGRRPMAAALGISLSGAVFLAWALAIKAYPDTYRRAQVPYLTVSVAHGRALYDRHCTSCHGAGGLGDGPLAAHLPKPPANLSAPHTALHTAGDMFWWLTHGIPESAMPGFASAMSEEERWDVINFLRAFSQGFESRVLGSRVVPRQAWLGAINFYLDGVTGPSELKGYRETHNVLLVFLGGERSQARAERLADAYQQFAARRTQVIAVPLAGTVLRDDLPYPVVRAGGDEIWEAYQLLTRSIGNRGAADQIGMDWQQAELLIDRFGYIRARWMVEEDPTGWSDPETLFAELERLIAEPQIKPFPDNHIH